MKINWKPHTTPPIAECPTSILVAWPAADGDGAYLAGLYNVKPGGIIEAENDGTAPDEPYFWITEDELLETLPCAD